MSVEVSQSGYVPEAQVSGESMVAFSTTNEVAPGELFSRLSRLKETFFKPLSPLEQKQHELLLSSDQGNTAGGALGEFVASFTNGKELLEQTGVKAFDSAQTIMEGLPVQDQVAMLAGLECMSQDVLDKKLFTGADRDMVYDFKVQLRQTEKQIIAKWLEDTGRKPVDANIVADKVGVILSGRQVRNAAAILMTAELLTACSPVVVPAVQAATEFVQKTSVSVASEVDSNIVGQEKTPTVAYEPTLLPTDKSVAEVPAVNPPDFAHDTTNHDASGPLTLRDAYAVYQLSRMVNGKQLFHDDPEFIKAMEVFRNDYMKKNPNITLMRASKDGVVDSGIKRDNGDGTFSMIFSFKADGAVAYPEPGYFDPSTTQEWVTLPGEPELFVGDDKHTYAGINNSKGEITSWLKTVGANRDNIDQQLVTVTAAESAPAGAEASAPEGVVKTADGASVFVKEGKLWQLDTQGQAVEKDILDVTFADVVDSGSIVRQLHPEYYENDQKLLKETLLPEGVAINKRYKLRVDDFPVGSYKEYPGIHDVEAIGCILNVSRVKWGEKRVAVMNIALVGADQPIPVVMGVMEGDSQVTPFISQIYFAQVGTDPRGERAWDGWKNPKEPPTNLQSFADSYLGSIVEFDVFGYADPEEADEFYGWNIKNYKRNPDHSKIINDSATHQMANTGWLIKQEGFKTSGEFLSRVIEDSAKDPEKLGPGFVMINTLILIHRDK